MQIALFQIGPDLEECCQVVAVHQIGVAGNLFEVSCFSRDGEEDGDAESWQFANAALAFEKAAALVAEIANDVVDTLEG